MNPECQYWDAGAGHSRFVRKTCPVFVRSGGHHLAPSGPGSLYFCVGFYRKIHFIQRSELSLEWLLIYCIGIWREWISFTRGFIETNAIPEPPFSQLWKAFSWQLFYFVLYAAAKNICHTSKTILGHVSFSSTQAQNTCTKHFHKIKQFPLCVPSELPLTHPDTFKVSDLQVVR